MWRSYATLLLLVSVSSIVLVGSVRGASQIDVTVDSGRIIGNNKLSLGFMLDWEWNTWRYSSVQRQLAKDADFKLVRLYSVRLNPCTRWYESSKTGAFSWANVDSLVQRIFEIGAEPLICLGKFRTAGGRLVVPYGMAIDPATNLPYPESYAAYCAEWVKHFKSLGLPVRYYEIVNEPYFYFGWDRYETKLIGNFAKLFNAAARSMRKVNSGVLLGNDAALQKKFLDYFVDYGEDLDFMSFHKYALGESGGSDAYALSQAKTIYFHQGTQNWYSVDSARQIWYNKRGKVLPVLISESNLNFAWEDGSDPRIQQMLGAVYTAIVVKEAVLKGLSHYVYYTFSSSARAHWSGNGFGMVNSDNNQPWYPYYVQKLLGNTLGVGDQLVSMSSSSSEISGFTWIHDDKLYLLLICEVDQPRTVYVHGLKGQLSFSKIDNTISWWTPNVQTGAIDSTQPLIMNGYTVALLQGQIPDTPQPPPPASHFDDFESGDFSKWTGTLTTSGETTTVASYGPYSGNYHGRFASNGGSGTEHAYCYKTIDMNEVYVRGYFAIERGLPLVDNSDRLYFLRLGGASQNLVYVGIRRDGGVDKWMVYARNGAGWMDWTYADSPVAEKWRWYCVELHWKQHSAAGMIELYVDGAKVLEINGINTAYYGSAKQVDFGLIYASDVQNTLTIYGDDCVVSQSYVGPETPQLFDDDFESGDFSKWTGTLTTSGETTTVASYGPYSGNYHGRFASDGSSGAEHAYCYKTVNEEKVYARGYFRIVKGLPLSDNDDRFYFIRFRAGDQSLAGVGIRRYNGVERWMVYGRDGSSWVWPTYATSPSIEMNHWYCIELFWLKDASQGRIEVYIDGQKIFEITGINTAYFGNVDSVHFGLIHAAGVQNNLIVYGDPFAISNTYIGLES